MKENCRYVVVNHTQDRAFAWRPDDPRCPVMPADEPHTYYHLKDAIMVAANILWEYGYQPTIFELKEVGGLSEQIVAAVANLQFEDEDDDD